MKKIIAVMLCAFIALGCVSAMAETNEKTVLGVVEMKGAFRLECNIPEGYALTSYAADPDWYFGILKSDDADKPEVDISIAFDDIFSDVERLNDVDAETLAMIEESFSSEDTVEITYMETVYGTKLMVVKEAKENIDFVDFYTIYKGYEVEVVLTYGEEFAEKTITEEQIQMVVDFLSNMDFVPVE